MRVHFTVTRFLQVNLDSDIALFVMRYNETNGEIDNDLRDTFAHGSVKRLKVGDDHAAV